MYGYLGKRGIDFINPVATTATNKKYGIVGNVVDTQPFFTIQNRFASTKHATDRHDDRSQQTPQKEQFTIQLEREYVLAHGPGEKFIILKQNRSPSYLH